MNNLYPANLIWDLVDSQFYIENYAPAGVNCLAFFYGKFKNSKEYKRYGFSLYSNTIPHTSVTAIGINPSLIVPSADDIFYRENKGLDAGAYKDMLCNIIGWDAVYQYDELYLYPYPLLSHSQSVV